MAITVEATDTGAYSASGPTVSASWAPRKDDLVVAWASTSNNASLATVPSGWVDCGAGLVITTDTTCGLIALTHLVTAAEETAGTVSWPLTGLYKEAVEQGEWLVVVARGVDAAAPIDAYGSWAQATTGAAHSLAGVTGVGSGSLVLSGIIADGPTVTYGAPSGWTGYTSGAGTYTGRWFGRLDALTDGSDIADTGVTASTGDEGISITVALTPAAGGTTYPASGTVVASSTGTGAATARMVAAASAAVLSVVAAAVTATLAASGTVPGVSAAAAAVAARVPASGTAAVTSTTAGSATLAPSGVSGTIPAASSAAGAVTLRASAAGAMVATVTASGDVRSVLAVAGACPATSSVSGAAELAGGTSGTVIATSTVVGTVTARLAAAGSATSTSAASGAVEVTGGVSGSASATSGAAGTVTLSAATSGTATAWSTAAGSVGGSTPADLTIHTGPASYTRITAVRATRRTIHPGRTL